ncbi:MAG: hypothetical protein ACTHN0_08225 [Aquihabitans sp.]
MTALVTPAPAPAPIPLSGQPLRYALSLELHAAGELSVAELIQRVEAGGFTVVGRASKTVSDALRWELGHRRVVRVGRGRYRAGRIPRSTVRWMQRSLARVQAAWRAVLDVASATGAPGDAATSGPAPSRRTAPPRATGLSGLARYRRQQRAQRAWEASLGVRPTWRRRSSLLA